MTLHVLCKDCWLRHDATTLDCRCKQCEANTNITRPFPLESKEGKGPFPRSRPLACRNHRIPEPLDIYCRECGGEVSPRALVGEDGIIAFVGTRKSGKTSLLWVLSEKLRQENAAGIYIRQPLGDTDTQMKDAVKGILTSGAIEATPAGDADKRNYAWEIDLGSDGKTVIAFHDAAGELWSGLSKLPRSTHDRFYRYVDLAGSIVFAIDGERLSESIAATAHGGVSDPEGAREVQLQELAIVETIGRRHDARQVRVPMAVVVTKADTVWEDERWSLFRGNETRADGEIDSAVRGLLLAAGRKTLLDAIEESFHPVRFFAISAFGGAPKQPLRIEDLHPARIEEPLLALLRRSLSRN